jgi:tetratricopeptide (TPR) repeat protein
MAEEYKYDVFISYSHKDEDWVVNTLLPALEEAGLKVCIDFRDFKAGKASIFNMQDSAKESRQIVLNLTRNWLDSEWSLFEALIGATKDPAGLQQKIIPLLSEVGIESDIHDFISMRSWVNFTRKDREAIAWKMLFTALGKPDAPIPSISSPTKPEIEISSDWHLAHPYPMPPNFTGREAERKILTDWLENDSENRLFILRALGGFGKSALAWHWLTHDVDAKQWPKVVWWSFYEGDASFENFIKETLEYLNVEIPPGQRTQVDDLLKVLQTQKILLIMDGFERALRAYSSMNAAYQEDSELPSPLGGGVGGEGENQRDCVNLNAEIFLKNLCVLPNIKSRVLMTTRLTPRAVEQRGELLGGCFEVELQAMQKEDAVAFFRAQGVRGARAEIENACVPYGYHPLSLRILAGLIANDRESPGDIAVAGKLDITDDVIQNKHHVLEVAYNTLSPEQQKLLSHIACFRSAMDYDALKAISTSRGDPSGSDKTSESIKAGRPYDRFDADLKTLEHRGLLHWDKTANKYDLHPIVRRYAYERLTTPDLIAAHKCLVDYFEAVPKPEKVEKLEDLAPVIELYHHMVRAGKLDEACDLLKKRLVPRPLHFQFGAYQLMIELKHALFPDGESKPPHLKDEGDQAWTLNALANSYGMSGQPRRAIPLFEMQIAIREKQGDKKNLAVGHGNYAMEQLVIGALKDAEHNLRYRIDLCREIEDEFNEAIGHQELGRVMSYRGAWQEAEQELDLSLKFDTKQKDYIGLSIDWAYSALRFLLMARERSVPSNQPVAIDAAERAVEMANENARISSPNELINIEAYWLLGAAYRANSTFEKAEFHLNESIQRCRNINLALDEADILLELAKLSFDYGLAASAQDKAQKHFDEARKLAEDALLITERSGYVLQGADVHLFLATLALEGYKLQVESELSDKEAARLHAEKALELAYCDGPPYYYKVAYEEAERFLEQLAG